jgi:putative endonuclease
MRQSLFLCHKEEDFLQGGKEKWRWFYLVGNGQDIPMNKSPCLRCSLFNRICTVLKAKAELRMISSTYILKSDFCSSYYIGMTSDPIRRLHHHNSDRKGFTLRCRPWRLVWSREHPTREQAIALEKKLKSWKSASRIELLIQGEIMV